MNLEYCTVNLPCRRFFYFLVIFKIATFLFCFFIFVKKNSWTILKRSKSLSMLNQWRRNDEIFKKTIVYKSLKYVGKQRFVPFLVLNFLPQLAVFISRLGVTLLIFLHKFTRFGRSIQASLFRSKTSIDDAKPSKIKTKFLSSHAFTARKCITEFYTHFFKDFTPILFLLICFKRIIWSGCWFTAVKNRWFSVL